MLVELYAALYSSRCTGRNLTGESSLQLLSIASPVSVSE